jgi:hypothetical protein
MLDDNQVVRLGLKARIEGAQRGIGGERGLHAARVLFLADCGPALLRNDISDDHAAHAGGAGGVQEPSDAQQPLGKRVGTAASR